MNENNRWQKMFNAFKVDRTQGDLNQILKLVKKKARITHPAQLIGREAELTPEQLEAVSSWLANMVEIHGTDERPGPYYWEDRLRFNREDREDTDDESTEKEPVDTDKVAEPQLPSEVSPSISFPEKYFIGDRTLNHTLGRMASFQVLERSCHGDWDDDVDLEPLQVFLSNMMSANHGAEADNVFLLFLAGRSIGIMQVKKASGSIEFSRDAGVNPNTVSTEYMDTLLRRINLDRIDPEIAEIIRQRITEIQAENQEQRDRPYIKWGAEK